MVNYTLARSGKGRRNDLELQVGDCRVWLAIISDCREAAEGSVVRIDR